IDEQLALERNAAASAIRELEATLADREGAFATALQKLQSALGEREAQLNELGGERDRVRQAASDAGDVVRSLHAEIESVRSAQRIADAEHQRVLTDAEVAFEHRLQEATAE